MFTLNVLTSVGVQYSRVYILTSTQEYRYSRVQVLMSVHTHKCTYSRESSCTQPSHQSSSVPYALCHPTGCDALSVLSIWCLVKLSLMSVEDTPVSSYVVPLSSWTPRKYCAMLIRLVSSVSVFGSGKRGISISASSISWTTRARAPK